MYNAILVDDEPRTRAALRDAIDWRKCGIRHIHEASGIREAQKLLQEENISVLICDIEMPGGSGLELVEWTQEHDFWLGIIFVTCHPEFDYMRKAIQLKCYDYILKPIDYAEFSRILMEMVQKMESYDNTHGMDTQTTWGPTVAEQMIRKKTTDCGGDRNVELEVKQYVKEHMMDNIAVNDIAEELHFNSQYLMRYFKQKTGSSIVEYMTGIRIETAKKILRETKLPIKEVAGMVGYQDYAYFTRVFKKECGVSPKQYRK